MGGRPREAILTGLGAITGDFIWLGLVLLGFIAFLHDHLRVVGVLGLMGGGLLLWMAWETLRTARRGIGESKLRGSYRIGVFTVLTSPFSFAWWMSSGPLVIRTWGWPGVTGLFVSLLIYVFAITYALRWLGGRVKRVAPAVACLGVLILAVFGVWFALTGYGYLTGGPG